MTSNIVSFQSSELLRKAKRWSVLYGALGWVLGGLVWGFGVQSSPHWSSTGFFMMATALPLALSVVFLNRFFLPRWIGEDRRPGVGVGVSHALLSVVGAAFLVAAGAGLFELWSGFRIEVTIDWTSWVSQIVLGGGVYALYAVLFGSPAISLLGLCFGLQLSSWSRPPRADRAG